MNTFGVLLAVSLLPALPGNVRFDETTEAGGRTLAVAGSDVARWRRLVDVYAVALYLDEDVGDTDRALEDIPRRLELHYYVAIPAKRIATATRDYFRRNADPAEIEALSADLASFTALYRDVRPGDRYALTYVPGKGTELSLNGELLGSVPGESFSKALFGIWIGADPLDEKLRKNLLRGKEK